MDRNNAPLVEHIYTLVKDKQAFLALPIPESQPLILGYVPPGWYDGAIRPDASRRVLAQAQRTYDDREQQWGPYNQLMVLKVFDPWTGEESSPMEQATLDALVRKVDALTEKVDALLSKPGESNEKECESA